MFDSRESDQRPVASMPASFSRMSGEIARQAGERYRESLRLPERWAAERVELALRHPDMTEQMAESVLAQAREVGGEPEVQRQRREQEEVLARSERMAAERAAAQAEQQRRAAEIARRQERQRLDRGRDFGPSR